MAASRRARTGRATSRPSAAPESSPEVAPESSPGTVRPAADGERKREQTRQRLLARALELFQQRGVEATTMRDIARAAGLSLGAAYYHFASKEALVFAYYEDNQAEAEAALVAPRFAAGTPRQRLGAVFHAKLESVRPQRKMLAAIVGRLLDPGDPLSALSAPQRAIRERAIRVLAHALDGTGLPAGPLELTAEALWLLQMASLLLCVHDDSPEQARTHRLVDDALDLVVPMLPLLATPMGQAMCTRVGQMLQRAGIDPAGIGAGIDPVAQLSRP